MEVPTYDLPDAAIAQTPVEPRDAARLLVALDPAGAVCHRRVADLPDLVGPGDLLVLNTTRVLPARLRLAKATGGEAEVLLLEPELDEGPSAWQALVRPGRRLPPGTELLAGDRTVVVVGERLDGGRRLVSIVGGGTWEGVEALLAAAGEVPLPPYIHRPLADPERYQTVYAERPGSVAAPTAGLHLTRSVLAGVRAAGAEVAAVDLAVGLGTFRPVTTAAAEDHAMHPERYRVPAATMDACQRAARVVAVGTTTVRALEAAAATGRLEDRTDLYIHGPYPWRLVDVLLTNFHQPRSTLLLLLEAFCGPRWRDLYAEALAEGYRFLSFGDAMITTGGRGRRR